ncbi:hypothetical protein DXT91_24655 [Agrobacterium tumefaciens]|nr:hypothetical protein [Agrobacterium tumefaciens]
MFRVGPTPPTLPKDLIDRAFRIEPATVVHVISRGFALGLRPVTTANRFAGTAITVRLSSMDRTALHYVADEVQPSHVVVIDMGEDPDRACIGAMVGYTLSVRRAAGVVIHGKATEIDDLEAYGLPVFARGLSPITTRLLQRRRYQPARLYCGCLGPSRESGDCRSQRGRVPRPRRILGDVCAPHSFPRPGTDCT